MKWMAKLMLLAGVAAALSPKVQAQSADRIRVSLDIQEEDSSRSVIATSMRAALKSIKDVDVVADSEPSDFAIAAVFICIAECRTFAGATRVYSNLAEPAVRSAFRVAGVQAADTAVRNVARTLGFYEFSRRFEIGVWKKSTLETEARRFIASVDAGCFEMTRTLKAIAKAPAAQQPALYRQAEARDWDC